MKKRIHFEFILPLNETFIDLSRPNGKRIDFVGNLNIVGDAYHYSGDTEEPYGADIDFVEWNGMDIKPVLRALEVMDTIEEAAIRHAEYLFAHQENIPDEEESFFMREKKEAKSELFELVAGICRNYNKAING